MNVRTSYDTVWRKRLDALSAVWPDFLAGEVDALHKARVASRRIREALPIVGASASAAKVKKLRRKLRSLTRHLGPIRELDVELGLMEKQVADASVSAATIGLVRREVASRRHALRARLREEPPVSDLKKLMKKLEHLAGEKHAGQEHEGKGQKGRRAKHDEAWHAALAATLVRRGKRLRLALDEAGPLYTPERIHDVRIATKKLRYALEIAQDAGNPAARSMVKMLKREQERLGRLHDLQSLLKHVKATEASPRAGTRLAELAGYADLLERECRRLHAEFVDHRDVLFNVAEDARQTLVPAIVAGRFRQARVLPGDRRARSRAVKGA